MTTKPTQNTINRIEDKSYNAPTGIFSFARQNAANSQINNAINEVNKTTSQSPSSNSTPQPPKQPNN